MMSHLLIDLSPGLSRQFHSFQVALCENSFVPLMPTTLPRNFRILLRQEYLFAPSSRTVPRIGLLFSSSAFRSDQSITHRIIHVLLNVKWWPKVFLGHKKMSVKTGEISRSHTSNQPGDLCSESNNRAMCHQRVPIGTGVSVLTTLRRTWRSTCKCLRGCKLG